MTERILTDDNEVLYRQVNPHFLVEGEFTSQIFEVTPKDEGELSIDQGSLTDPKEAHERFMLRGDVSSVGVTHVTVGDCTKIELKAFHKPENWNPAHGFVDFREIEAAKARKKKARKLKMAAIRYGWDYQVESDE